MIDRRLGVNVARGRGSTWFGRATSRARGASAIACGWALLLIGASAAAETSPPDTPLPDDKVTTIQCEHATSEPVFIGDATVQSLPGTYSYKVYVPPGYNDPTNAESTYPVVFVCSGSGNPSIKDLHSFARSHRWVVVLVSDAKNGPWPPIYGAFLATHDDAMKRLRIRDGLKIAMGASGGAAMTGYGITVRPGFVAWLPFIGSAPGSKAANMKGLIVHGVFGREDNRVSGDYVSHFVREFDQRHIRFSWSTHPGGHNWGGEPIVSAALATVRDEILRSVKITPTELSHMLAPLADEFNAPATLAGRKAAIAEQVIAAARRGRLTRDEQWSPRLSAMQTFLRECRSNRTLKNEVAAYDAWQDVLTRQAKLDDWLFIGKISQKEADAVGKRLDHQLQTLRSRYPDTEVVAKMAEKD